MADDCIVIKKNIGVSRCNKLPEQIAGMITTPPDFEFSAADALDPEFWQTALKAEKALRIYSWPEFDGVEDQSTETTYEETSLSLRAVRDGQYRYLIAISKNLCFHKAAYTHRGSGDRVILIDFAGNMLATEKSDGVYAGQLIQLLHTENLKISDGSVATKSPIKLALRNPREINKDGVLIEIDFLDSLVRLSDVILTIVSSIATKIVVDVTLACDGTKVNGLALADFVKTQTDGDSETLTALTEVDGRYSLSGVGLTSGFLDLVPAGDLSVDAYESTGKVVVTIA